MASKGWLRIKHACPAVVAPAPAVPQLAVTRDAAIPSLYPVTAQSRPAGSCRYLRKRHQVAGLSVKLIAIPSRRQAGRCEYDFDKEEVGILRKVPLPLLGPENFHHQCSF